MLVIKNRIFYFIKLFNYSNYLFIILNNNVNNKKYNLLFY